MKNKTTFPTYQDAQIAKYEEHSEHFDALNANKNRTYGLKVKWVKEVVRSKGLEMGKLLEVGCGTGLFTQKLAEALPELNIVATDGFQTMLNIAQQRLANYKNVQCNLYDISTPPPNNLFSINKLDIVCGVDIIHHIEDPVAAMATWRTLVKPNGILLFLECNPANPAMYIRNYNHPEEKRLYLNNVKNLTTWATTAGWKNVVVKNLPIYLPSGPKKMWNCLTKTEELIHKIPLVNKMSGVFLVYGENKS
ncbi:hypothetical protein FACS1894156_5810 [Bacteroidia bacterium]|nr:hypothetical protein FACS1894156_5810 [Bacteroidia bacterium]